MTTTPATSRVKLLDDPDVRWQDGPPPVASPSWWAVDARHRLATTADGRLLHVKQPHPATLLWSDAATAVRAAWAAAAAGSGPSVVAANEGDGTLVTEHLEGARVAGLHDLLDDGVLVAAVRARTRLHTATPDGVRTVTLPDVVGRLLDLAQSRGARLPGDLPWILRGTAQLAEVLTASGHDAVLCHGDGTVSNLLLAGHGASTTASWVDYDCAGAADPTQDLGSFLLETDAAGVAPETVLEIACGRVERQTLARARLYGVLDDLRWVLIAALVQALAQDGGEYAKYGSWRLWRLREQLRDPGLPALAAAASGR